jgi:Holliday junction resolvase RusA-like endonuclease
MNLVAEVKRLGLDPSRATIGGVPIAECGDESENDKCFAFPGELQIVIFGPAIGKPRLTQRDKWAKRPQVVRYYNWANRVRALVSDKLPPAASVQSLDLIARFEPPHSWPKKRRIAVIGSQHRCKPDVDNLLKAGMDALWKNDSAIGSVTATKLWDWNACLEIWIRFTQ